jgi:hypothetical protein
LLSGRELRPIFPGCIKHPLEGEKHPPL